MPIKRNTKITFRLTRAENDHFKKLVKKSGLSQEGYIRQIINGLIPTDAPPPDYYSMMRQLHSIGNNLNQIAQKANTLNVLDMKRYEENVSLLNKAVIEITNAVMLPRKMK